MLYFFSLVKKFIFLTSNNYACYNCELHKLKIMLKSLLQILNIY